MEIPHRGIQTALPPHSLIRFTWVSPYCSTDSEVEIRLTPVAAGTKMILTQVTFPSESARAGHFGGWSLIPEWLDATLQGAIA